jgi:hypothetical protein
VTGYRRTLVVLLLFISAGSAVGVQTPRAFADRVAQLSEPAGYFDTDNLISNEQSYLQVMPALRQARLSGGAYIGVGPDQNFSYIAALRPSIAFIVDIRRDNLLLQLLFKALFETAETRVEYLCALFDCAPPASLEEWKSAPVTKLVEYVAARPSAAAVARVSEHQLDATIRKYGVPLSEQDFETIHRFRRTFIDEGLELRFHSTGRAPQSYYPTYRQLLVETDPQGQAGHFLASEESYAFVRALQTSDLVIPVVGDLSGRSALVAIARLMRERGETLSAFYVSNVENYLFQNAAFGRFVGNLGRLPRSERSVIIRSVFGGYARSGGSASQLQRANELVDGYEAGRFRSYGDVVMP